MVGREFARGAKNSKRLQCGDTENTDERRNSVHSIAVRGIASRQTAIDGVIEECA
jgi:hypothetical protein